MDCPLVSLPTFSDYHRLSAPPDSFMRFFSSLSSRSSLPSLIPRDTHCTQALHLLWEWLDTFLRLSTVYYSQVVPFSSCPMTCRFAFIASSTDASVRNQRGLVLVVDTT